MEFIALITIGLLIFAVYKITPIVFKYAAFSAYNKGNNEKALKLYKRAAETFGKHTQYQTEYALLLMRTGDFKSAERILTSIICDRSIQPNEKINVKAYRAMAYQKQGELEDALEEMEDLYQNVKTTVVYGMYGYLKLLKNENDLEFYKEAYDYNSDDRDICDNYLVALIRNDCFEEAEEIAKDLREKYPQFVEAFYHSAVLAQKQGDAEAAKEYMSKLKDCRRSTLTTVSEEEIRNFEDSLKNA